jgi:hypothetical protein
MATARIWAGEFGQRVRLTRFRLTGAKAVPDGSQRLVNDDLTKITECSAGETIVAPARENCCSSATLKGLGGVLIHSGWCVAPERVRKRDIGPKQKEGDLARFA